ncbi:MAG: translation elongation factor 4 [Candidatus Dojkabacteria bacterium]|nr:translation elongation factor 4 [Candidatus Dojkabacteria bacterium]
MRNIRNFCIIAHIDHGKSTLADRLIEYTGTLNKREMKDRVLDTLELEQERGITIKLQTARLKYQYTKQYQTSPIGEYTLNLIDTPGHVDFSYEVSRSIRACEGALLLVDATQGIQAQTIANVVKALEYDLKVIPVINKIDMGNADIAKTKNQIKEILGFNENEILLASGKTGVGIKEILDAIVERIPPPKSTNTLLRALVFDAFFHEFKGVTALIKVVDGEIQNNDTLCLLSNQKIIKPIEIGFMTPKMQSTSKIQTGDVGYIATGLKDIKDIGIGDTITLGKEDIVSKVMPLPGYTKPKPFVFASLYPVDSKDFLKFKNALEKLSINDSSLTYEKESSQVLGTGFLCGFLGLLHLEITQDRLEREFGIDLISTIPSVEFKVHLKTNDYTKVPNINISNIDTKTNIAKIRTAIEFPEKGLYDKVYEPWLQINIYSPEEYLGQVMELCQQHRGIYKSLECFTKFNNSRYISLLYEIPTIEIVTSFFDKLKSITHGYASMDYSFLEYRESDIVKVNILVNGEVAESISFLTHCMHAEKKARMVVEKLKELIPRQQFKIPIQAAIGNKIIAREDIPPYRKDVLQKLYGGDVTRKIKLLEKQKKGKKKMQMIGKVNIPKDVFIQIIKLD